MPSDLITRDRAYLLDAVSARVLFVAWRNPITRSISPIGKLTIFGDRGDFDFRFEYLKRARETLKRPLTSFPEFDTVYESRDLFPLFVNRMVSRASPDYPEATEQVGLDESADPFEVLSQSGGVRETDLLEVFPEPIVYRNSGRATFNFLVRGIRHRPGADDVIDSLSVGDLLGIVPDTDNPVDNLALLVVPGSDVAVGWIPAYLCPTLHKAIGHSGDQWGELTVIVRHIGDRNGPSHFRLLCEIDFPWTYSEPPFVGGMFASED